MNSIWVLVLIVAGFLATISALPSLSPVQVQGQTLLMKVEDSGMESNLDNLILEEDSGEMGDRFRRATCDLLSVSTPWGSLNHSACAAHCLSMRKGFRGGRCKDGVCHCRR